MSKGYTFDFRDNDILAEILLNKKNHIPTLSQQKEGNCVICYEEMKGTYTIMLLCGDTYHRNCLLSYVLHHKNDDCAVCQAKLETPSNAQNKPMAPSTSTSYRETR